MFEGKWKDLKLRNEIIEVKDGENVNHTVRYTHHGPVFNENNGFFNKRVTIIGNFSFAWSFLDPAIGDIVKHQIDVMRCKTAEEMIGYFTNHHGTVFNFVFGDKSGNIGFAAPAAIPKRKHPYHGSKGISEGYSGEDEWVGYNDPKKIPHIINPSKGYIATANNFQGGKNAVFGSTAGSTA